MSTTPWSTALTAFGEEVGVAFQISDDLLDIVSQGGASGKSPGTDLREGIATLPALFALAGDDPAEARLRELVAGPDQRRRRPRRGAGAAALVAVARPGQRGARASTPTGPAPGWPRCRPATSATRCRRCATTWSPAPAEAEGPPCRPPLAGSRRGPAWRPSLLVAGCTVRRRPAGRRSQPRAAVAGGRAGARRHGRRRRAGPPLGRRPGARRHAAGRRARRRVHRRPARRHRPGRSRPTSTTCSPAGETGPDGARPRPRPSTPTGASTAARASRTAADAVDRRHRLDRRPPTGASATRVADPLIGDIPVNQGSGRHGGCRLRFTPDGRAADRHRRQRRRQQPAGPVLAGRARCCSPTRRPARWRSGPTGTATCRAWPSGRARTRSSRSSRAPAATTRSTCCGAGGNYGYDPDGADGGYDESVPMTDTGIPGRDPGGVVLRAADDRHLRRHVPRRRPVGRLRRADAARRPQGPGRARAAAGRRRRAAGAVPAARARGHLRPDPHRPAGHGRRPVRHHRQRRRRRPAAAGHADYRGDQAAKAFRIPWDAPTIRPAPVGSDRHRERSGGLPGGSRGGEPRGSGAGCSRLGPHRTHRRDRGRRRAAPAVRSAPSRPHRDPAECPRLPRHRQRLRPGPRAPSTSASSSTSTTSPGTSRSAAPSARWPPSR